MNVATTTSLVPSPVPELDQFLEPTPVAHHLIRRPWGQMHSVCAGPEHGPAVLLVHGWPEHWFAWRHVITALAPTTRVVAVDLRGMGWSTPDRLRPQPTTAELADDLVAVSHALHLDRPMLVAHDWGGWAGFRAVIDHPQVFRSYLAMSILPPWVSTGAMARNFVDWAYMLPLAAVGDRFVLSPKVVRWLLDRSTRLPAWGPEGGGSLALASYQERLGHPEAGAMTRRLYASFLRSGLPSALGPRPRHLTMPAAMLVGEHETIARPEIFWPRTLPGELPVVTVPGARHWLAEEAPRAVIDVITSRMLIGV